MATAKKTKTTKTTTTASTPVTVAPTTTSTSATAEPMGMYSLQAFLNFISQNFSLIFIVSLFFLGGFLIGSLWTENQILKKGGAAGLGGGAGVGAGAGAGVAAPTAPSGPTKEQLATMPKVSKEDRIRGKENAQIIMVEYSDLECPFCQRFHPTMAQIKKDYGDKVAWVWRHYPLPFHSSAQKAAEASECVGKIGGNDKFWEFVDLYFARTDASGDGILPDAMPALAGEIGVNQAQVKTCLDSGEMAEKVKEQMSTGSTAGVSGTPGTILVTKDGDYEFISGALPLEQVKATLDKYL